MQNYELKYMKNVETKSSGLAFSSYEISNARNSFNSFQSNTPLQPNVVPLRTYMKEICLVITEKRSLNQN